MKTFNSRRSRIRVPHLLIRYIVLFFCTIAFYSTVHATTYYLRPDGNDTNNGLSNTADGAWATLYKAAGTAQAGDVVNIATGNYSSATTATFSNSGTSGSHIAFTGSGTPIFHCNVRVNGSYIDISGITVSPDVYIRWEAIALAGQYITLDHCTVKNYNACAGDQAVAITLVDGGAYNTVQNCTIRDLEDIDVFHVWGHNQTIRNVYVTNVNGPHYDTSTAAPCGGYNHTDFFQTWGGWDGVSAYDILVEGCTVVDCAIQLGNTANSDRPGLHDITFRNNIFANIAAALFTGVPYTRFYNNIFYNVGDAQGYAVSYYNQTNYSSAGDEFKNNVFLANMKDIDDHNGANNVTISNNYFADADFSAKTNGEPRGSNFVNGGDPKFVSISTSDFHIQENTSPLINAGTTLVPAFNDKDGDSRVGAWDIGVDEYGGTGGGSGGGGSSWENTSFSSQTGPFTAEFDAVPSSGDVDGVIGLTSGAADEYSDLACNLRFNVSGFIDALKSTAYVTSSISYLGGTSYHFRLEVNLSAHSYSAYVTPSGGSEQMIGTNMDFRAAQSTVSKLNNLAVYESTANSVQVSNISVSGATLIQSINGTAVPDIYPNPAGSYITISGVGSKSIHVQLYDLQGVKVLDEMISGDRVDLSALNPGMYLLKLDDQVFKLMVE